nr:hypothetical protein [Mycoplasmopsis bovis]
MEFLAYKAEKILGKFNITVNKNTVPFDELSPAVTSGIRIGTAAMTSRKFNKWSELGSIMHWNFAKLRWV